MRPSHWLPIDPAAFLSLVEARSTPEPNTGCWLWLGSTNSVGYPMAGAAPRILITLRLVGLEKGDRLYACHHCDNPTCVNPAHLYAGTARENNLDAIRRGRKPGGWKRKPKTQCKNGHPFNTENCLTLSSGFRQCRICNRAAVARYNARRLEAGGK